MREVIRGKKRGIRIKTVIVLGRWFGNKGNKCRGFYIDEHRKNIWMKEGENEGWIELKKGRKLERTGNRG